MSLESLNACEKSAWLPHSPDNAATYGPAVRLPQSAPPPSSPGVAAGAVTALAPVHGLPGWRLYSPHRRDGLVTGYRHPRSIIQSVS
jgi:hypothetical protein